MYNFLVQLLNTQERMTGRQFVLDCSTNMFDYFGGIASYMVIAIPIFAGVYDNMDEPALSEGTNNFRFYGDQIFFTLLLTSKLHVTQFIL